MNLQQWMTVRYVVGLLLVACVMIGAHLLLNVQVEAKKDDAHIINISGMQRMLSQRISLMAREIYHAEDFDSAELYLHKLEALERKMRSNHETIQEYIATLGTEGSQRDYLNRAFYDAGGVNERVLHFLDYTKNFLQQYYRAGKKTDALQQEMNNIVSIGRNGLLMQLDEVVGLFEEISNQRISDFQSLSHIVLALGLLLLACEAIFIFRPMVQHVSEKTKALEQSNMELTEFSYRISHDLRAPIVSSRGLVSVIGGLLRANRHEKAYDAIDHVMVSLKQIEVLIDDIVQMTKLKLQEQPVKIVNIANMTDTIIHSLQYMQGVDKVQITNETSSEHDIAVRKIYLEQILSNLISNAVKYHDPEKDAPFVKITSAIKQKLCTITIEDNGIGIPKEYRSQLFGMFKRFHPKTSYGSGLGLYLVKQNVKALGGTISYSPTLKGSIFTISFPFSYKSDVAEDDDGNNISD